jgi:putative membrane protein
MLNILAFVVKMDALLETIVSTLIFVFIGLVFFALAFGILGKATPFSIRKEIEEDQNTALGIVIGAVLLGISIIIAAAISG